MVDLSGGNPRELLLFGAHLVDGYVRADDTKDQLLRLLANKRLGPSGLTRGALRVLKRLARTGSLEELTPVDLPFFSRLLDTNRILHHHHQGELRFDVHPLLRKGLRG